MERNTNDSPPPPPPPSSPSQIQQRQPPSPLIVAESTWSSRLFILTICILFRWWNAYLTRTYDNPDEYWQGPEIAHGLIFGYGYKTWEWIHGIRSYFHPLVFTCLYQCLAWCHLDTPSLLTSAPRYLQATISAIGDVATYTLAKKIYGNHIAPFILVVTLTSWFNFLMAPRTLSNTMETVFTVIAMKDWPFAGTATTTSWLSDYRKSLFWASLACITRPTNALIWGFLGLQLLYHAPSHQQRWTILVNAGFIVSMVLMVNVVIDTYFYTGHFFPLEPLQSFIFVPWKFLHINVVQSMALFYGAHPFHWYLSQGLPLMLLSYLPLTVLGMVSADTPRALKQVVVWVVCVYSLLSHKEFRFIYPIFPLLMLFTAHGLATTWRRYLGRRWRWVVAIVIGSTQFGLAMYVSLWHQRGVMDVMTWLRQQQQQQQQQQPTTTASVGFLMPCHSTPWQSVMHQEQDGMWFLTCEPPLDTKDTATYMDQAARFYQDPVAFLSSLSSSQNGENLTWPDRLVMFDQLLAQPGVAPLLQDEKGYVECQRFFNSHVHWDGRRKGDVVVLCAPSSLV